MASDTLSATAELATYPRRLLVVVRSLIDRGEHSIAVVVAHMACEIAMERRLSEAFLGKRVQYLQDVEGQSNRFWSEYSASVVRRNDVIHRGVFVDAADAEKAYKAADDFLNQLKF